MFTDTHCHLTDERYADLDLVVNSFRQEKVSLVINNGYNILSSKQGKDIAEKYKEVYFTVGVHPSDSFEIDDNAISLLKELSTHPKCVGIGEIGLDYHWDYDKTIQKKAFEEQILLSNELKLPFQIHSRDATEDTINTLKNYKRFLGNGFVMHCYSGSVETAKIILDLGGNISFAGTLTFKNANNLVEVAKFVPIDRVFTETDSPYLTPHPFRGKTNEPKMVSLVLKRLAEIKGLTEIEMANAVRQNALKFYGKVNL